MGDQDDISAKLNDLKGLGVRLAIDDFGTGYSSLSYLRHLPVETLKIDKSFISGLGRNPKDRLIASATISLAQALELSVVAEGVETARQAMQLRKLGCDLAQGNYFAKPLASKEASDFIAANT
jgi:EAL domain-containing protein (putative c-di-GMP-specific phosphodiesterase class I)